MGTALGNGVGYKKKKGRVVGRVVCGALGRVVGRVVCGAVMVCVGCGVEWVRGWVLGSQPILLIFTSLELIRASIRSGKPCLSK